MKITVLVEGRTEMAFKPHLRRFLLIRIPAGFNIDFFNCGGRVYKEAKLTRTVEDLLRNGHHPPDAVIALTDVLHRYSGFP